MLNYYCYDIVCLTSHSSDWCRMLTICLVYEFLEIDNVFLSVLWGMMCTYVCVCEANHFTTRHNTTRKAPVKSSIWPCSQSLAFCLTLVRIKRSPTWGHTPVTLRSSWIAHVPMALPTVHAASECVLRTSFTLSMNVCIIFPQFPLAFACYLSAPPVCREKTS